MGLFLIKVNIVGTTLENFLLLLEYIYSDHTGIQESDSVGLMVLADEYFQSRLVNLCELYITKEVDRECQKCIEKSDIDVIGLLLTAQVSYATTFVDMYSALSLLHGLMLRRFGCSTAMYVFPQIIAAAA